MSCSQNIILKHKQNILPYRLVCCTGLYTTAKCAGGYTTVTATCAQLRHINNNNNNNNNNKLQHINNNKLQHINNNIIIINNNNNNKLQHINNNNKNYNTLYYYYYY